MSRPVYSRLFSDGFVDSGGGAVIVLPDDSTYVLRDITWRYIGATSGCLFSVAMNGFVVLERAYPGRLRANGTCELRRVAPGPTELSIALTGSGGVVEYALSGYELTP